MEDIEAARNLALRILESKRTLSDLDKGVQSLSVDEDVLSLGKLDEGVQNLFLEEMDKGVQSLSLDEDVVLGEEVLCNDEP